MFGPDELPGVLPRAGKQIFDRITELHDSDHPNAVISRQCSVQCSFLQIYNERISGITYLLRGYDNMLAYAVHYTSDVMQICC